MGLRKSERVVFSVLPGSRFCSFAKKFDGDGTNLSGAEVLARLKAIARMFQILGDS